MPGIRALTIFLLPALLVATSASADETTTYTYDAQGRLVKVERSGTANNGEQVDYNYDDADNRTNVEATGETAP